MFSSKDIFLGKGGATGYQISRSVRLRSSASAYFNRTPASASNRQTWTWSSWVKRSRTGQNDPLFDASNNAATTTYGIRFENTDVLQVIGYVSGFNYNLETTQVFRDPSAWYHIVVAFDDTQATASNRIKVYVNGSQVTSFTTATYPAQNTNYLINDTVQHRIGSAQFSSQFFDGYLTEINFIDGQALTPSSFGATNTTTGVWGPAKYTGTYGTNGFYLNFSDNSGATATTIGKDSSGNGNNWTPNNISVTAGVTYDSMVDTPTPYGSDTGVGGEVRGNYAVLNPVVPTGANVFINGNLTINAGNTYCNGLSTIPLDSGKYYAECVVTTHSAESWGVWLNTSTAAVNSGSGTTSGFYGIYSSGATKITAGAAGTTNGAAIPANGDIVQVAWSNGSLWLGKNNTWYDSSFGTTGNPSTGANPMFTGLAANGTFSICFAIGNSSSVMNANFGQRPFTYTAPSGYQALCTQNLSTPTIANGASYMAASLYTGNGGPLTINNSVNGVSFQPDFVWVKSRSNAQDHILANSIVGANKNLYSNRTTAEATNNTGGYLSAFTSSGFTAVSGSTNAVDTVANGYTYVGWQWLAGKGSSSSNTQGSITSTVSVNQTAGFSVVTYTGSGSSATVGHGLGVAPSMIIIKNRGSAQSWRVYHTSVGVNAYLLLDSTATSAADSGWTGTSSTTFTVGGSGAQYNASTNTYVAYCFAPIAGYSAFGSYTGNGSTDGTFVYLGFRPKLVIFKDNTNAHGWLMVDSSRNTYNVAGDYVWANSSNQEDSPYSVSGNTAVDFLSNGFKLRNAAVSSGENNTSGATYLYACFAENPFKYSLAR